MQKVLNSHGVALLQALVMVNVMALTAAAMMIVILSGFMGTVSVEQSTENRGAAEAAIAMAYEDLHCFDDDVNGAFSAYNCGTPRCIRGGCGPGFCRSEPPDVPACYGNGTAVPPPPPGGNGITMAYDVDGLGTLPVVPVNFAYTSSSYTITARGNVQQ